MSLLRHSLRSLAKSPGFSAVAVLMLSLGIGLSAGSFSMTNAFLLRNVPYPHAEQLVRFFSATSQFDKGQFSPGNLLAIQETATSYSGISIFGGDAYSLVEPGTPAEQVQGMNVTANFFDVIGVKPVLGRGFAPGEDTPDKPRVAVLSHRTWMRRYNADPAVLGRSVRLNKENYTIVGVLPESFSAPLVWGAVDYILPQTIYPSHHSEFKASWLAGVGRLKDGVPLRQAQTELAVITARLVHEHPTENAGITFRVVRLHDSNMDDVSRALLWLMTAISLAMLVIACANLASLQVARAFGRAREFAVRAALGGDRRQLMLPLLAESFLLALVGGVGGLFVAAWSNDIVGHFLRISDERGYTIPLDGRVLAFAVFASVLSGVAFGFAPAWLAARAPAAEALKEGARGSTAGRTHQRLKSVLIILEVALALAVVGVATSFGVGARTFLLRQVGWQPNGLFCGYLNLPWNEFHEDDVNRAFQKKLMAKLETIPGVEHAVMCGDLPLFQLGAGVVPIEIEGKPAVEHGHEPITQLGSVSPDYFAALQINLKAGRLFSKSLTEKDPPVIVVNESFAKRFWPDQSAIGHRVRVGDDKQWWEIIGVVGDIKLLGRLDRVETPLQLYRPHVQAPTRWLALVLRTSLAPASLTKSVREAVAAVDPNLPVMQPGSVTDAMDTHMSNLNLVVTNLGISAGMGLLIAAIGLFGVISQLTAQRTRDIGVRMALGAQAPHILGLVLGGGLKLLGVGVLVGVPGYFALNRILGTSMPSLELPGLWLLAVDVGVLSAAMLLACYLPALRATRVNPTEALRSE